MKLKSNALHVKNPQLVDMCKTTCEVFEQNFTCDVCVIFFLSGLCFACHLWLVKMFCNVIELLLCVVLTYILCELISSVTLQLGKRPHMISLEKRAFEVEYLQSQRRVAHGHQDTPTMKILRKHSDNSSAEIILSLVS